MIHKAQMISGATGDDYRAGGHAAGEKAGKKMLAECGALGSRHFSDFAPAMAKAKREALDQMRRSGATDAQLSAWEGGFDGAMQPHLEQMRAIETLTGKR